MSDKLYNTNSIYNANYDPLFAIENPPLNYNRPLAVSSTTNKPSGFSQHVVPSKYNRMNNNNILPHAFDKSNTVSPQFTDNDQFKKPILLDDNVEAAVMDKSIMEYPIIIDSVNRSLAQYPDPFNYKVTLRPNDKSTHPYIYRDFQNVKYVKLESALLPKQIHLSKTTIAADAIVYPIVSAKITVTMSDATVRAFINTTDTSGANSVTYVNITWTRDPITPFHILTYNIEAILNYNINTLYVFNYNNSVITYYTYSFNTLPMYDSSQNRYIVLNINEIRNINENSTSDTITKSFSTLYPTNLQTGGFVNFSSGEVEKTYKNSELANFKNFTISFVDSNGNNLSAINTNLTIDTPNTCVCGLNTDGTDNIIWRCCSNYIRHPFYTQMQNNILLKIGIYENSIEQNLFYSKK
ncbi:MAG: hypothetical protein Faunusvirus23_4 [Faunusvirus sp.]|jgi:hypothetical protein|uniref:Uncharacterized protein n=1 Tax=Faunusvirus sp. TaxID=2487766 RepID=A0A3G4ZXD3_9VIRU|nr:MAG: hypothetical protein Faunusvirus23_4 [Faunusvirus sp.]